MLLPPGAEYGIGRGQGDVKRYTSNTNGGPVFVYVKEARSSASRPSSLTRGCAALDDPGAGQELHPPAKTTVDAHTLAWKSMVYSPDRLLYPMKRVDFDPKGERNPQNRGISGYERISWDEALDIVAGEIQRVKRQHGPGAIMNGSGSHHTWGNLGYWLSARHPVFQPHRLHAGGRTIRIVGKAGTGERRITGATAGATAAAKPTAPSKTA